MKGWFDAFRNDGGPTLYTYSNRTPVTGDINTISILLVFSTLLIAFLLIFPGIRKQRFTTFVSVILSLYTGTVILAANHGSTWHVGSTTILSTYRTYSSEKLHAHLGAYISLNHVNVTLKAVSETNETRDIDFNERFYWIGSHEMGNSYKESLKRGLPFPILTVAEYLSLCQEGFNWGAHYRAAGYYAQVTLWAAFASWLLMNLLLISVPRYGAFAMTATGLLMLLSVLIYWTKLPPHELVIRIEESQLSFKLGSCFYIVAYSAILCIVSGSVIAIVDCVFPHKFSTVLEVDFDTPYDRHIIIEDSHETRDKKNLRKQEEPPQPEGLGSKLLRRLSKRSQLGEIANENNFELDPPKSPWRYPFRPTAFPALNSHSNLPPHQLDVSQLNHLNDSNRHLNDSSRHLSASNRHLNGSNRHLNESNLRLNDSNLRLNDSNYRLNESTHRLNESNLHHLNGVHSRDVGTDALPVRSHIQLSRPPARGHPKYPFNRQMSTDSHDSVATDHSGSSLGLSFIHRIRESTRIPPSPLAGPPISSMHDPRRKGSNERHDGW